MRVVLLLAFALALGCSRYGVHDAESASVAPFGPPSRADAGTFCWYRPTYVGFTQDAKVPVFDNGRLVGAMSSSGYFCWLAEPGPHRVTFGGGAAVSRFFRVQAGERIHLVHQQMPRDVVVVPEHEAAAIAADSRQVAVTEAPDGEMSPQAERVARALAE